MNKINPNDYTAIIEADREHVWHHATQHAPFAKGVDPRIIIEGKDVRVWDAAGREYIDAVSGAVWTVNVGYGRRRIADAVAEQLTRMNYFGGMAGSVPAAIFAEMLLAKMPGMKRVYLGNSGSEGNEKAFKMVRQISTKFHGGKKRKILYRDRDYHGTTIATLSAGGHDERNAQYGPFLDDFVRVPHCLEYRNQYPDAPDYGIAAADAIEAVILREGPENIGALCLETITAGGGCITPPEGYWPRVQEICDKYDILLHIDEVVCGMGRTGEWFGYQHYGIKPDFVVMAKGVASGYAAISCMVTSEKIFDMFRENPDDHLSHFRDISTFGGCTGGPAAAIENMKIIEEEGLLENCTKMGEHGMARMRALMDQHKAIGDVRGKGLFMGIELVADRATKAPLPEAQVQAIVADCAAQGVIIGATSRSLPGHNNTLLFAPPMTITTRDLDAIFDAVSKAIAKVTEN